MQTLNVAVFLVGALALVFQGIGLFGHGWVVKEVQEWKGGKTILWGVECGLFFTRVCNRNSYYYDNDYSDCRYDTGMNYGGLMTDSVIPLEPVVAIKVLVLLGWVLGTLVFLGFIKQTLRCQPTKTRLVCQRNCWFLSAFFVMLAVISQAATNAYWDVSTCFPWAMFIAGLGACLALCEYVLMGYMHYKLTHEEDGKPLKMFKEFVGELADTMKKFADTGNDNEDDKEGLVDPEQGVKDHGEVHQGHVSVNDSEANVPVTGDTRMNLNQKHEGQNVVGQEQVLTGRHTEEQPQPSIDGGLHGKRARMIALNRAVSVVGLLALIFQGIGCFGRGWVVKEVQSYYGYQLSAICGLVSNEECTTMLRPARSIRIIVFLGWALGILACIITIIQAWRHQPTKGKFAWTRSLWFMSAFLVMLGVISQAASSKKAEGYIDVYKSYFPWAMFMSGLGACFALADFALMSYMYHKFTDGKGGIHWQNCKELVGELADKMKVFAAWLQLKASVDELADKMKKFADTGNGNVDGKEVAVDPEQGVKDHGEVHQGRVSVNGSEVNVLITGDTRMDLNQKHEELSRVGQEQVLAGKQNKDHPQPYIEGTVNVAVDNRA